jgi:hypothetical protein
MKRKIYLTTVWIMVIILLPLCLRANIYTERRNLFVGGYFEYLNTTEHIVDKTYENKARVYRFDVNLGMFMMDNFALGLKVGYGYSRDYERDTSLDSDYTYSTDAFRIGIFMRNYIELSRSIRFFIESSVVSGFGGIDARSVSSDTSQSYTSSGPRFELEAGIRPGMVFFINRGFAVEATVGFLGFTYTRQKTGDKQFDVEADSTKLEFSWDVNLIRIQFGLAIYF